MGKHRGCLVMLFSLLTFSIQAQQSKDMPSYITAGDIEKAVHENMDRFLESEDYKELKAEFPDVAGEFVCDVTVKAKKETAAVKKSSLAVIQTIYFSKSSID